METLPIITLGRLEKQNAMFREYLRLNQLKTNKVLLIKTPKLKQNLTDILIEKDNIDFSEKLKQHNKEFFSK